MAAIGIFLLRRSHIPTVKLVFLFQLMHLHCRFPLEGGSNKLILHCRETFQPFQPIYHWTENRSWLLWIWMATIFKIPAMTRLPVLPSQHNYCVLVVFPSEHVIHILNKFCSKSALGPVSECSCYFLQSLIHMALLLSDFLADFSCSMFRRFGNISDLPTAGHD